jgi:Protein of unknown function (DUF3500)
MTIKRIVLASFLIAAAAGLVIAQPQSAEQAMARAARALLATLDAPQVEKIRFAFNSEERFNWHYIPRTRLGLPFKEMNDKQREAALALIKVGLSQKGFTKTETIRSFEPILRAMENGRINRDPDLYFVSIFGDPDQPTWGWRYEGHHIAQNWTIANGKAISTTPAFLGANPAVVRDGPQKGTRPLAAEEDLARALVKALTPAQQKEAIVNATAPTEILTTNTRKSPRLEHGGILASTLTREQQGMLMTLIEEHAMVQSPALAQGRLAKVKADTLAKIRFAWLGTTDVGGPHYYSIQGESFLIEYDNTQNGANHQHVVWRDFAGDFGVDVLAEHYARDPAHRVR